MRPLLSFRKPYNYTAMIKTMGNPFTEIAERLHNIEGLLLNLDERLITTAPPAPVGEAERFLTKKEVATVFGVSEVSVWDWEKKGLLTGYRIGNLVRYKYSEVMASPKMIQRGGQTK